MISQLASKNSFPFFAGLAPANFQDLAQEATYSETFPCAPTEPAGTYHTVLQ